MNNSALLKSKKNKMPPVKQDEIFAMFDRIAPKYDFLNRVLSFGQDMRWRRRLVKSIRTPSALDVLDVATGTGDLLLLMYKGGLDIKSAVGIDMAENMLRQGQKKLEKAGCPAQFRLKKGDATDIPFENDSFDIATIAFGIRNVCRLEKGIRELARILRPQGKAVILEFSLPAQAIIRNIYLFYFRHVLPVIGSAVSGQGEAYRYLNKTVESFPYGEDFAKMLRENGFSRVEIKPLTFGIASIYIAQK